MKNIFILSILLIFSVSFAVEDKAAQKEEKKKPILGDCSEYTDYYIYKCTPFKCKLPIDGMPGVYREMETIGFEQGYCIHKYKFMIRTRKFTPTDLKMSCKLTEKGRLELANQFTAYKKGDTQIYANPENTDTLNQECWMY
ncbi:MAG: hypothetical protein AABY27_06700 [Pseudomonadota bacterium]